jgi:hypothetical protein
MSHLSEQDLRSYLRFTKEPLSGLRQDENWWRLGPIDVSKKHPTFRAGFGHPILAETRFELQPFDIDGRQGIAIILHSGGKPPEYFVGWVDRTGEATGKQWVADLNAELRARLSETKHESDSSGQLAGSFEMLSFEQGHEYAPDSPYGLERGELAADGRVVYERRNRGANEKKSGVVDPQRVAALYEALRKTSFPTPPQHRFTPGASIVKITLVPSGLAVNVDYFEALRMDGYRDVVGSLSSLLDAIREGNADVLTSWGWRESNGVT